MTTERIYLTTTIPYVNARPAPGPCARVRPGRRAGPAPPAARRPGRFQTGTDDNSLKNVLAAEAAGVAAAEFVDRNAAAFAGLREPLALSFDDFIRTSSDPRHRAGVERLWRACADSGDLYRKHYEGLYCVGCEQFYTPAELADGLLPRARDRAGAGRRGELVLPAVPLRRPAARPDQRRASCGSSPPRGATRCSASSTAGSRTSSRLAASPSAPTAGASPCPATRTR